MRTKINTKKQIRNLLFVPLLIAGLVCTSLPSSAASAKVIVDDVDGNGKISIGDTFCLGSECFYVTANKDGQVKALAKYNLYVGANYDKKTVDINKTYATLVCSIPKAADSDYECYETSGKTKYYFENKEVATRGEWKEKILDQYKIDRLNGMYEIEKDVSNGNIAYDGVVNGDIYEENGEHYQRQTLKLYPYTTITSSTKGYALQNSLALGVHGEKGNAIYPLYATSIMFNDGYTLSHYIKTGSLDNFATGYTNFEYNSNSDAKVPRYLSDYADKLVDMGYDVSKVDIMTVSEIDELVHAISNKNLPLAQWYEVAKDQDMTSDDGTRYTTVGDLKEYVGDDYSWIWSTTYWTKTLVGDRNEEEAASSYELNTYFISTAGNICYSASDCWSGIPRAGIRPVITMAEEDLTLNEIFSINGTVKWIDNNNFSKIRPNKSVIKLYRNGVLVASTNVVATDDPDLWKFSFANLAKYDANGKEYVYTITQNDVPMYSSDITNFDVVNQYAPNPKTADGIGHWAPMLSGGAIVITAGAIAFGRRRH